MRTDQQLSFGFESHAAGSALSTLDATIMPYDAKRLYVNIYVTR